MSSLLHHDHHTCVAVEPADATTHRLDDADPPPPRPAPGLGEHTRSAAFAAAARGLGFGTPGDLPLTGRRVLDLTAWWAGPKAQLAGADQ